MVLLGLRSSKGTYSASCFAHSRCTPSLCPIGHNGYLLWHKVVQTTFFGSFNQGPIGPWAFLLGLGWSEPLVTFLWTKMVQSTSQEPYPIEHFLPLLNQGPIGPWTFLHTPIPWAHYTPIPSFNQASCPRYLRSHL